MKLPFALLAVLLIVRSFHGFAQVEPPHPLFISGNVYDSKGEALAFSTILLLSEDSSLVRSALTDSSGHFFINVSEPAYYHIKVSYVGFTTFIGQPFELKTDVPVALPDIILDISRESLEEVVVKAERPLIEARPDKTVLNVEGNTLAAGRDVLELMNLAPGVMVDFNENITLRGRSGVRVHINGRPSHLSAQDLASFLKSKQASEIQAIEVITAASSKYEAEGSAGIINIILKKEKSLGTNGTLGLGYQVGMRQRYNGYLSGNHRNRVINIYGDYGLYSAQDYNKIQLSREQFTRLFDQVTFMGGSSKNHSIRLGTDISLSKNSTLSLLFHKNINTIIDLFESRTNISQVGSTKTDSILLSNSDGDKSKISTNLNANYQYKWGNGKLLNLDADYGGFTSEEVQFQPNSYYDESLTTILQEASYLIDQPRSIKVYSFKSDYEQDAFRGRFSVGLKSSIVKTENNFQFFNVVNNQSILDTDRSNDFTFIENINSLYVNYAQRDDKDKVGFHVGVRMEQTNSEGDLMALIPTNNQNVKRTYLDFFPSGGVIYQVGKYHQMRLSYSRRIGRPNYQQLNPFENKLDELTFQKGNPFLRPEYANEYEIGHTYKGRYSVSFSYSLTNGQISRIVEAADESASVITNLNLNRTEHLGLSISAPFSLGQWYEARANLTGYKIHTTAGLSDNKKIDLDATALNIYFQNSFKLTKKIKLELTQRFSSPTVKGTMKLKSFSALDLGVQMAVLAGKGRLRIAVSDVFQKSIRRGTSTVGDLYLTSIARNDSRRLRIDLSYRFGNDQVKTARHRALGAKDENARID